MEANILYSKFKPVTVFFIIISLHLTCFSTQIITGDYLGEIPPGSKAKVFAPGIVSTKAHEHSSPSFSKDGNEVYWSIGPNSERSTQTIMFMKRKNNIWSLPKVATFSGRYNDGGPVISFDGKRLYFYSQRPLNGRPIKKHKLWHKNRDLIYVERQNSNWSEPKEVKFLDNIDRGEIQFSISRSGNLVFISLYEDVQGDFGIYESSVSGENYKTPLALSKNINSKFYDWTPFIAPDESYLLFCSYREGGIGSGDLYISFKQSDNSWSDPVNMGAEINTSVQERFPSVTRDGKYLFFTRATENNKDDIFWVSASIIEKLRKETKRIK